MKNLYFATNFSDTPSLPVSTDDADFIEVSNHIYDTHRNITHAFVPYKLSDGTIMKKLVSDTELCMSTSPAIRAVVSADYQERLRTGLMNQPRSAARSISMTDDELAEHVIPNGLEPDEAASCIKFALDSMQSTQKPADLSNSEPAPPSADPAPAAE